MTNKKHNQVRLEDEMVNLGRDRYNHKVKRAKETSLESTTGVGQRLLGEAIGKLTESIDMWVVSARKAPGRRHRALEYMEQLPSDVIAGLTARCILDCISMERRITSTSITLGRILEDEVKFRTIRQEEPALWNQINRNIDKYKSGKTKSKFINNSAKYHDLVLPIWSRQSAASVGLTCIELMRQATGIIEIITKTDQTGKSYTIIKPTDELIAWMRKSHEFNERLSPVWLPMVEKPNDWNNPWLGGYQSTHFRRRPLVKTNDREYLEELANCRLTPVYSAVNSVQNTGFRVNQQLTDALKHCWDKNLPIGGIPPMEDEPLPPKPENIGSDKDARRAWRKQAARTHFENERLKSKRLQVMRVISLAEKFSNDNIYYPMHLDFRTRGYPVPYFLQPSGPSWAKSLLSFSQGTEVTDGGTMWLYINAANKWGLDKLPYDKRIEWVEGNLNRIRGAGNDLMSDMFWSDADDPWAFAAACIEINRLHTEGSKFRSTLPISIDATTQGLQLYAMLLRDPVAAAATNVLPNDVPMDPYGSVSDVVRRKLYENNSEFANKWLKFGIDRKTCKRQTMTLVYGSSYYSCRHYTTEWFFDCLKSGIENPFGDSTYKPCNFLAEIIWEAISEVVGSALIAMEWLRGCAKEFLSHGVIPRWSTPLGFPVKMHYENTNKYVIKTLVSGVLRQHRLRIPNGDTNSRKTINAICANFIHSLDGFGGLLGETINLSTQHGVKSFLTVHDSISTTASEVPTVAAAVREATVSIFDRPILENLADQFDMMLPASGTIPDLPQLGNLDITQVRNSKYYFN